MADTFFVWERSDGFVGATAGFMPRGDRNYSFRELLRAKEWAPCAIRIRAERTAAVMNEDLFPIAESAASNRDGVTLDGRP